MRTKNIGNVERAVRVVGGVLLAALGLTLQVVAGGPLWLFAIDALLVALGLDFLVTGVTGHCPLYRWLGWSTAPSAGASAEGEVRTLANEESTKGRRPTPARSGALPAGPSTAVVVPRRQPGEPVFPRRRVLQMGFWSGVGAILAGTVASGVDFLYPRGVRGFGGKVSVTEGEVPPPGQKRVVARGRFWLSNLTEEQGGPGLLALWWKCPHLGCTVPWKEDFVWPDPATGSPTQGWFRCPCHGSTYTDAGVLVYGPAPRPLDTMELVVEKGRITVDTGKITPGAPDNPQRAVRI